ncbi:hypothetical protein HK405_006537 [Cladochytrium tenue]|nr:hypothetical protein HK405_006537 [Cladochytrium tenue]
MLSLSRPVCPAPRATRLNRHSYQQQKNQRSASRPIGPAHPRLSSSSSPSDSPCSSDCTTDDEMGDSDDGGGVASDSSGDSSDGDDDDDDASFCSDDSDPSNLWPARQLPATASYVAAAQHSPILLRPAAVLRLPRPVAVPSAPRPPLAAWAPPTRAPRQLRLAEHSTPSSPPPVAAAPHTSSVLTSNPTSSPPTLRSTVVSAGTPLITPRSVPNPASPLPPPHSSSSPPAPSAASAASLRRRGLRHPAGFPGATATATTSPPTAVPSTALGLVAASPPRGGHGGGGATASSSDDDPPTASHFESPRSPMLVPTLPYSRPGDVVTAPAPVVAAAEASPDPSGIAAAEPATSNPPASPVQLAQLPQPAAITDLSDLPQPPSANDCTGIHRAAAVDDSASPGSVGDGLPASPATTSAASPPPLPTTATADYTDATSCTGAATRVELDSTPHAHTPAPADALADTTPVPPPSTRPRRRRAASADEAAAKTAAAVARVALAAELAAATTASRRAAPAEGPGAAYDPTAGPLGVAVPAQRADSGVDVATAAAAAAAATAAAAAVTSPALSQLPGDVEQLVTAPSPANGADYAEPVVPCAKLQTPPHPLPAAAATDKEHATTLGPLSPSLVFTTHEHALPPNLPHSAIGVPDTTLPPPPPPPLSTVSGGGSGAKSDDGPAFEAPLALPLSSAITDDPAAQPLAQSPLACPTGPTPFLLPPPPPAHSSPAAPAAPPNWQDKLLRLLALPARLGARLRLFMWRSSAARVAPAAAAADADADAAAALEEDGGGGIVSSGGSRRLWPAARRVAALRGRLLLGRARPRGVAPWEEHGATVGVGAAA